MISISIVHEHIYTAQMHSSQTYNVFLVVSLNEFSKFTQSSNIHLQLARGEDCSDQHLLTRQ